VRGNPPEEHRTPLYRVAAGAVADAEGREWKVKREAIGIGETVARPPLPHDRTCGSASGGSAG
jgi:hypothetical protein